VSELIGFSPTSSVTTQYDPIPVTIGSVQISGHADLLPVLNASTNSFLNVGLGIYKAEWDDATGNWEARTLFGVNDIDQPWLYFSTKSFLLSSQTAFSTILELNLGDVITKGITLRDGEAIMLAFANGLGSTTNAQCVPWFEAFIEKVG
jgi:hypothetical protein